jgi:hypothetical protein
MWFRVLSLAIGAVLLLKAAVALAMPERFYAERRRQYASESVPGKVLVGPAVIFVLALTAWYATIFHYQAWGWIVTGFLTALGGMAANGLIRWESHRRAMHKVVSNPKVWQIDCLLLLVGAGFFTLALLVF